MTVKPDVPSADFRLEQWELDTLATYNAEVARGLVHADKWRTRMGWLQTRFDTVGYVNRRGKQVKP